MITYYSTNGNSPEVSFKQTLIQGLAPDKGLFMAKEIPKISIKEIKAMKEKAYWEIAFFVANKFLRGEVPEEELSRICKESYNFPVPLENVFGRTYLMRLD